MTVSSILVLYDTSTDPSTEDSILVLYDSVDRVWRLHARIVGSIPEATNT